MVDGSISTTSVGQIFENRPKLEHYTELQNIKDSLGNEHVFFNPKHAVQAMKAFLAGQYFKFSKWLPSISNLFRSSKPKLGRMYRNRKKEDFVHSMCKVCCHCQEWLL